MTTPLTNEAADDPVWTDPRITAYALGELPADESARFQSEMAASPSLQAAVEQARGIAKDLEQLFASESIPSPPDATVDSSLHPVVSRQPLTPARILFIIAGLAAVFIGVLLVVPVMRKQELAMFERESQDSVQSTESQTNGESAREVVLRRRNAAGGVSDETSPLEANPPTVDQRIEAMAEELSYGPSTSNGRTTDGGNAELSLAAPTGPVPSQPTERDSRRIRGRSSSMGNEPLGGGAVPPSAGTQRALNESTMEGMMGGASNLPQMADQPVLKELSEKVAGSDAFYQNAGNAELKDSMIPYNLPRSTESQANDMATDVSGGAAAADIAVAPAAETVMLGVTPRIVVGEEELARTGFVPELRQTIEPLGSAGDRYEPIIENGFERVTDHPLSTFSIDVDTASYTKVRSLIGSGASIRPDMVRIEEFINYFDYDYAAPAADNPHPFSAEGTLTDCPWNDRHQLVRIGLQGKRISEGDRPSCNLVFLVDSSGSMSSDDKLPLVIDGLKKMIKKLNADDRVSIVTYAGSAGLVLPATSGDQGKRIRKALKQLSAGGSTNGGQGIQLAYDTARDNFIDGGVNRVILCSDGDFNVGTTSTDALVTMVEKEAKSNIFLTVLGFGHGNHNDSMMEQISGRGNGTYGYIDSIDEARRWFAERLTGTLVTIAKDVKIQIEFNPAVVGSYRLIGYENRMLAKQDFNDDSKDAGEIGSGHQVTALYEIVPADNLQSEDSPQVDPLKYSQPAQVQADSSSDEVLTLKLRYKPPTGDVSTKFETVVANQVKPFAQSSAGNQFAVAVAGFAMQLRRSEHVGTWTINDVIAAASSAAGDDPDKLELVDLVRRSLSGASR